MDSKRRRLLQCSLGLAALITGLAGFARHAFAQQGLAKPCEFDGLK